MNGTIRAEPTHRLEVVEIKTTAVKRTVQQHRERLGMSKAELAKKAGVSESTIYRIEASQGSKGINNEVAEWIAGALGVKVRDVAWPCSISHVGRPAGTGKTYTKASVQEACCPSCHYVLLPTGSCGNCE